MKKVLSVLATLALALTLSVTALAAESMVITLPSDSGTLDVTFSSVTKTEEMSFEYEAYDEGGGGMFDFNGTLYYLGSDCTFEGYSIVGSAVTLNTYTYVDTGETFEQYSSNLDNPFTISAPITESSVEEWLSGDLYVMPAADVLLVLDTEYVPSEAPVVEEVTVITAEATDSTVLVDGEEVAFEAYNIADNNYFKLRDIAQILSGSAAQFEVDWDGEKEAIDLVTGQAYTTVGGELAEGDGTAKEYVANTSTIYLNGDIVELTAYTINDNNYFKLRDLGEALGFNVSWDNEAETIVIASDEAYTAD